jgi:hypothetical protein
LKDARNDGFYDPFDPYNDATLWNYWGLFQGNENVKKIDKLGKLDWTLFRHFHIEGKDMGNHDYRASDHKYLLVEAVPDTELKKYRRSMKRQSQFLNLCNILILFIVLVIAYFYIQ